MPGKTTPDAIRQLIIEKHLEGCSIRQIGQDVDVPSATVGRTVKHFQEEGRVLPKKSAGRPEKPTELSIRVLLRMSRADPRATAWELRSRWVDGGIPNDVPVPNDASNFTGTWLEPRRMALIAKSRGTCTGY